MQLHMARVTHNNPSVCKLMLKVAQSFMGLSSLFNKRANFPIQNFIKSLFAIQKYQNQRTVQ